MLENITATIEAIDHMHVDIAIAQWKAAGAILEAHDGHVVNAQSAIQHSIGHGIDAMTADHLRYLVDELAK